MSYVRGMIHAGGWSENTDQKCKKALQTSHFEESNTHPFPLKYFGKSHASECVGLWSNILSRSKRYVSPHDQCLILIAVFYDAGQTFDSVLSHETHGYSSISIATSGGDEFLGRLTRTQKPES